MTDTSDTPEKEQVTNKSSDSYTVTNVTEKLSPTQTMEATSVVQQKPGQSVNVEIHVTVNTSPTYGSGLADLKKQRNDQRSSSLDNNGKALLQNGHFAIASYNQPPSPSILPQKFHGDPLEVVGEKRKKKGCCHLM